MCEELEDANRGGNMRGVFQTVKALGNFSLVLTAFRIPMARN